MARIVKCPRCNNQFDASNLPPGSTVPCASCGTLTRIPTGSSAQHPAAAPPASAAPSAPAGKKTTTKVRHRGGGGGGRGARAPRKKSNTGLVVGLGLGAVALAIVIAAVIMSGQKPPPPPPKNPQPSAGRPTPAPSPPPTDPTPKPGDDPAAKPKPKPVVVRNADKADWDKLMRALRPGGGFDAMDRPEGQAFARVKSMGKGAYPYLVEYIGDEDVVLARAAVAVLNELSGRSGKLPNETTRAAIKAEWEKWLEENK